MFLLFIKRFFRRLRYCFRLEEMWKWEYESCNNCGINYRLPIGIRDDIWLKVNGKEEGCLCINCFLQIAEKKEVEIKKEYIDKLYKFNPKGLCFDIINRINLKEE